MDKRCIKDFSLEELRKEISKFFMPSYRADQIFFWLYKKGVHNFSCMTNLPEDFRDTLSRFYYINALYLKKTLKSSDGTEKFLFELCDKRLIESVIIPSASRYTLCLSTQVGCKYGCVFCASGANGFKRNLSVSEIIDQILYIQHVLKYPITNIVFMGMGEPLDNYENVSRAIMIINDPKGLGLGAGRITVSTCGIVPGIHRLKDLGLKINLSLSLHAANDTLRNKVVPINKIYPLQEVISACLDFKKKIGTKITLEYVLLRGLNDSSEDSMALARIAKRLDAKVNLIPCSPAPGKSYTPPDKKKIELFRKTLLENGINVTLRNSRGLDIQAGCGQLAMLGVDS